MNYSLYTINYTLCNLHYTPYTMDAIVGLQAVHIIPQATGEGPKGPTFKFQCFKN